MIAIACIIIIVIIGGINLFLESKINYISAGFCFEMATAIGIMAVIS